MRQLFWACCYWMRCSASFLTVDDNLACACLLTRGSAHVAHECNTGQPALAEANGKATHSKEKTQPMQQEKDYQAADEENWAAYSCSACTDLGRHRQLDLQSRLAASNSIALAAGTGNFSGVFIQLRSGSIYKQCCRWNLSDIGDGPSGSLIWSACVMFAA